MRNKQGFEVSYKQGIWLDTRGGRDEEDVYRDEGGLYVFMFDGENYREKKVYLPDDKHLTVKNLGNFHKSVEVSY